MKLKKLAVLLCCLALVFAFAACGEEPATEDPAATATDVTEPAEGTPAEGEAALPEINTPQAEITFNDFTIKVNDTEVTYADLKDCQIYKVKLDNLLTKDGTPATDKETGEPLVISYTGYKVADILAVAGVEGSTVYAVASDGFESEPYDLSVNPDYLIIAVEKDKEQAADGTVYFAPCFEQMNGKYVKAVNELVVE